MGGEHRQPRAAIIGAGPSGFYAADSLLRQGFRVDLYDMLPSPFGLVRAGVAPDHPRIKSVTRVFERTASNPDLRFFGGVQLGNDISRAELRERYEAVVYAVGTDVDTRLGIPGEDLPGSHPATHFVAWYNAHPAHAHHRFDLSSRRAVVIGNGNVALDVARMLLLHSDLLRGTDTADHAIEQLAASQIQHVTILGRRGPAQAAFSTPELRELGELDGVEVRVDADELVLDEHSAAQLEAEDDDSLAARRLGVLREFADSPETAAERDIELRFLRSPLEVLPDATGDRVGGLLVSRNRIQRDEQGRLQSMPTDERETLECGLVIRAIGYRGRPLDGLPFDQDRGIIRNVGGRVVTDEGDVLPGEYVVGWIKRGPSGVIGTNKSDADETVSLLLEDLAAGLLPTPTTGDPDEIVQWLGERVPFVGWSGWQAIDGHERERGESTGRPRVKITTLGEMHAVAGTVKQEEA